MFLPVTTVLGSLGLDPKPERQKHTSGPWIVANGLQVWFDGITAADSPRICSIKNGMKPVKQLSDAELRANAQLIAAAPDMLEALEEVEYELQFISLENQKRILAAIRKARG